MCTFKIHTATKSQTYFCLEHLQVHLQLSGDYKTLYMEVHIIESIIPKSSNSRSRRASWSLSPCNRPLVAKAIDGGICKRSSVWPIKPLAAAAWARAWAWSCWQVAYILKLVAIKKTPTTSQSCKHR